MQMNYCEVNPGVNLTARRPLQCNWRMELVQALPQQEACYIRGFAR